MIILLSAILAHLYPPLRSMHHRRARIVIMVTFGLILADAILFSYTEHIPYWHGVYVTLANAETFGGDIAPSNTLGYIANFIVCVLLIPLVGATAALVTSGLTEEHVRNATKEIKEHVTDQAAGVKQHVTDQVGS